MGRVYCFLFEKLLARRASKSTFNESFNEEAV